ncbi:MAG: bifunctional glutamate N-acetyltransferase/amino-acid acetyltransferase ArgJ [Tabrizicola sp.]|uniref:bifunctional glutamate N-acetyltransferase/amino-acid acetyltransferase ArgJ n=1 Tax=Tabrizicola sp. TaxID=2005166 RepID=UPI00273620FE|nr:bifunctional glutamate N-acetyltransferase/amino-acid acetyltransferase ArgJ [Tabrizicola sp.]MDP3261581.1 bifunctional glutamate N-acetyltransferase/amino-acid acetyltransferase ArgJ [Tabrizicola sp.]MDP3648350.1 bifunctional glutamate N-acetyltransferase/amino-acid acetyltransferase ArgJ [Paracoccaceae bacterium]MDZ4067257.1 bifunctional glutamate N-acetyltransferase/amino-acid acetyltransferase ArgJ [Tabrizicola sp.]
MGKTDWKAKAKALKKKLRSLTEGSDTPPGPVKKAKPVSPLAPASFPALPTIAGVEFAAVEAGVRYLDRKDVMLVRLAPGTAMAGVFTRSTTRSACVRDCQAKLALKVTDGSGAAIVVNSGNSNAFTGRGGDEAVAAVTSGVAAALGIPATRVFSSSTGVIGEPLPHHRITAKIPELAAHLREDAIEMAALAMMTTDTFPKGAAATVQGEGGTIHIAGIAKGSGMIAPDMATMLVYIFTDARISAANLQKMLSRNVDATFNSITVDSDTSTSDTLLIAATGRSPAAEVKGPVAKAFETALHGVMRDLALQVVRDGEGATKLVEVRVTGAASNTDAAKAAFAIANSPLVKTAIAGQDPNWGRIVAAIGKSGAEADRDRLSIRFGDILVAANGWRNPDYKEVDGAAYMQKPELLIHVDMGLGTGKRSVWTCDLTSRYIEINADYRS